jgi:hypothetical protein
MRLAGRTFPSAKGESDDLELEYAVLAGLCAEMLHRIASLRHHGLTQGRGRVN